MRFADFALDASRRAADRRRRDPSAAQGAAPRAAPQRAGGHRPLGQGRAGHRAGRRAATSTPARACRRTASSWPSSPGTCPTCRGTARRLYVAARRRGRRARPAQEDRRRGRQRRVPAGVGRPTAASISSGTRPAGASSIAGRTTRIVRVHGARGAELARPQWVFGSRSYALAPRRQGRAWSRCGAACRCSRCGS